ncbi:Cof-type HAD-IIB family hydrolase [Cohnella algarum]|uniref:Cof-type HAD-IIB family hydrolase n=1 Tax=Cohnella algarum TaxID=2044859 RepID=UPI001966E72A|nr:Cof-type HAD-IIB family hydrolase [Cohnella algarum]MBN2984766.1 HAD family phosphatase [Cohnella algarum]
MTFRLIALDVDGTLLNDEHELTPRVRDAVRAAAAGGAEIVLCTGRGSNSALPVLDSLGLEGTLVTHNGACIVESKSRKALRESVIEANAIGKYLAYCRESGVHFDMNTAFDLYVESMTDEIAGMYERLLVKPILWEQSRGVPEGLLKVSIFAEKEALDRMENEWASWEHELQTVRSGDYFFDVQHKEATKGAALAHLASQRGVRPEEVLAIGNYYNDIGMIRFAGLGVAMANSPDPVKEAADETTVSNNEDGVAVVLEEKVIRPANGGAVR